MDLAQLGRPLVRYGLGYAIVTFAALYVVSELSSVAFPLLTLGGTFVGLLLLVGVFGASNEHFETATAAAEVGASGSTDPNTFRSGTTPVGLKLVCYAVGLVVVGFAIVAVLYTG